MIDEVGSEESPESVLSLQVEAMPEVGVELLFSSEEIVDIIGKIVLVDVYSLDIFCSRELVLCKTKREDRSLWLDSCLRRNDRNRGISREENSVGSIRIS